MRTRVKICGITRVEDAAAAVRAGTDAIGLVFYPLSPRCLSIPAARRLRTLLPPFVSAVALFVNASPEAVAEVCDQVRPDLLQFHGEEPPAFCAQFGIPYVKACRMKPGVDLLECMAPYPDATAWLADAFVDAYGGVGAQFDWSMLPAERPRPLILSGGLDAGNVADAIRRVRPWAVDVSSGVESEKGIKDAAKISAFIAEVRNADA
ncbi:MAG: phosphoribosylanthranilate isomerase [Proteobacteria bacterium]|nr:phosphoribosylanthranilate isomerase [Pseudomonadota bacterium]